MKNHEDMFIGCRLLRPTSIIQAVCLILALMITGCASTKVSNRQSNIGAGEKLPKPAHIWVYDFVANPADVPADSAYAGAAAGTQTEEQIATGRELGNIVATTLVEEINNLGLSSVRALPESKPSVNDIVIRGYLVSVEQGSTAKRMTLGFGAGGSELEAAVEGYQMTATGLRKLGSASTASEGSKGPGAAVGGAAWLITGSPVGLIVGGGLKVYGEASGSSKIEGRAKATAKEIGDFLEERFKQQGWIN
jgi:hypothetical protein